MDQALLVGATQGAFYALLATGFVIGYLVTSCINLAHGVYAVVAIFLAVSLQEALPLPVAMLAAVLLTAACGAATEWLVLRHAAGAPALIQALLTIGLAIAAAGGIRLLWDTDDRTLPSLFDADSVAMGSAVVHPMSLLVVAALVAVVLAWTVFTRTTLTGKTLVACSEDATGARLCGVPVSLLRLGSLAVAAGVAGLGGVLIAPTTFVTYESGLSYTLFALIGAALGGFRSIAAAVGGGLLLGLTESLTVFYVSSQLKTAVTFAVLLLLLTIRPAGLVSSKVAHA